MGKAAKIARRTAASAELQTAMNSGDMEAVRTLTTEIDGLTSDINELEAAEQRIAAAQATPSAPAPQPNADTATRLSPGMQVARSKVFEGYDGHGATERVRVQTATRAIDPTDVTTDVVSPLAPPRRQGLIPTLNRPLRVRDLFDNQYTDDYSGEYVQEIPKSNKAGWVAQGASKPLQDFAFETKPSTLRTVAAAAVLTRQALRSPARIAGTVNGRLAYNLDDAIDSALVAGNGTSQPLGLLQLEGRNQIMSEVGALGDGAKTVIAVRKGLTQSKVKGKMTPDAILMSPVAWETVEITRAQGDTGNFILTPNLRDGDGNASLWGKPVVDTDSMPDEKVIVGAFKSSTVWQRDEVQYYASDSHEGFFLENKVVLLAETEIVPEYYRPSVYTEVTLLPA